MLRIGIIGMGFMGRMHFKNWKKHEGVRIAAVCDANPISTSAAVGNIDTGEQLDLKDIAVYSDLRQMLEAEQLDAVSITLPTHLHKDISIQCLQAGLHVLCEKPMALNVEDCDAMIVAAHQSGCTLMVAQCIRFWPAYSFIKGIVEQKQFGKVIAADLSRLSIPPGWGSDSWFSDSRKSGGIALDLHIHDLDFLLYLFGYPDKVHPLSAAMENGTHCHLITQLGYKRGPVVSVTASWMMPKSFGFEMSFKFIFERASAVFDGSKLIVYPEDGDPYVPELAEEDGYHGEIRHFRDLITGRSSEIIITPEQARESVRLALETV